MKNFIIMAIMAGTTKYCSNMSQYKKLDEVIHPSYIHQMESTLADDINSTDSATHLWAADFMAVFEKNFREYHPQIKLIEKLKLYKEMVEIRVIGGNWCGDTRREVPRLGKVLYYMGVPEIAYSYFRVNHDKKAIDSDFASTYIFENVPTIVVFKNGKEAGKIIEFPKKTLEEDLLEILKRP